MAAREENILNVPLSETLEGMHVLCDTGDTGEPYRVAASLFIAEATQAAKDAVANLDPKDVILKGFTALTAGKPAITANSTLLAAIQSLYAMVGSGKVKIVSDGADQTGMVCWNGISASGFVINVNEAAIYTRSQWTQASPDSVTDANWIAAVKTGGVKNPFNALNTLLTGWVNRSIKKPTITSTDTIFDALKALYWASGNGTVLNISNGKNRFGFVGWNENTAYGFMLDTATLTIYIRQWAQGMDTSNANTAALWREAIQGGEAFGLKHPLNVYDYSGDGNIPSVDLTKVKNAEVFTYELGGQRAPLFKVTGDDTMVQFSSAPIVENGDPSSGEPLENHYMSVVVNLSTGAVTADIVPIFSPEWLKGTEAKRLTDAVKVTAFTEGAISQVLNTWKTGDMIPFYTDPLTKSDANQAPESSAFSGFISMGANEGDHWMVMAMATSGNYYMGHVLGSTASWTKVGGGGEGYAPLLVYMNEFGSPYEHTNLASLPAGAVVPFEALGGSPDDMGPFIGEADEVRGIICIRKGKEVPLAQQVADVYAFNTKPKGSGSFNVAYMQINNDASGAGQKGEWIKLTTGSSSEIFPGWKQIVSSWSSAVGPSGTTGIIYFNQEIPTTSKILIEATIQSSPATTATIKFPVPLTIADINGTGQGVLFEICSKYLGINSTPGSIKLICWSVIPGANGVQGMNVIAQSDNLSDASVIIQIKGIYFKA